MKLLNVTILLTTGILVGCTSKEDTNKSIQEPKDESISEVKAETIDPKAWKDLSTAGDLTTPDFPTNVRGWIDSTLTDLNTDTPDKYFEAGSDKEYDM